MQGQINLQARLQWVWAGGVLPPLIPALFYSGERFVEPESPQPLRVRPIEGPVFPYSPAPLSFC